MSARLHHLGSIKLDIEQPVWSDILDLCVEDYNPAVPQLWDQIDGLLITPVKPKRTRNLTPSLLFSLAVAKAIESQAWKTIPGWSWQQTKKAYTQHNVHLDGMRIAGVGDFETGNALKEWIRDQCSGTVSARQILPTDRDLNMGNVLLTIGHYMRDILGLSKSRPDEIPFRFSMRRARVERLLQHFNVTCDDGDLSGALIAALKQSML